MNMGVWLIKMMMIVIIIIIFIIIIIIIIINNCIAKWRLGAWDIQELPILITSQCSPEVLVAGIFAGCLCLEHRLLLLDKTTENDSLFFL